MFRPVVRRRIVGRALVRTAVVGGVAYGVGHHAATRSAQEASQEQRIAELEQQQEAPPPPAYQEPAPPPPVYQQPASPPAPAPSGGMTADKMAQLKQLGELRQSGILTDAEFEGEKQKILRGY